jgi:hypothetical protein
MELSLESQSHFGGIRGVMAKILNRDVSFPQVDVTMACIKLPRSQP